MLVMNDYAIFYRLDAEKIKAIKSTTVYYVIVSDNDIYHALIECKYRNIKLRKITREQYYIITRTLNRYPKQIIEYFLQNGIDKTKELMYYNNKKRDNR